MDEMDEKRKFHPQADEKNMLVERRGKPALLCGAKRRNTDARCRNYAGAGTSHKGWGRCSRCGGNNAGPRSEEGKQAVSQNARKHGFYSPALSPDEQEVFEAQTDTEAVSLLNDIKMLRAKIIVYLTKWRKRWDGFYKRKLAEKYVKYRCTGNHCDGFLVRGDLEGKPGYCHKCGEKRLEEVECWVADRTPEEAEAYADSQTKVWYSEGEKGGRSYYHAGSIEDRAFMRAMAELGRYVEKYHRIDPNDSEDLLGQINAELRAASSGRVSISWGGPSQQRINPEETPENGL